LLVEESAHPYLSDDAAEALALYREDFRALLSEAEHAIQVDEDGARWWTFAGGQINHTLKYALMETTGWKIVVDNFHLRFEGSGITHRSVEEAILAISVPAFWEDLDVWRRILAKMPPYRLSKFQPALPPRFEQEMIGRSLLDIEGTRRFLVGDAASELEGVVEILRAALAAAPAMPSAPPHEPAFTGPTPEKPLRFIDDQAGLVALCLELSSCSAVGLDVETTLVDHDLCLVQLSTETENAVIDARAVTDLAPLAELLESSAVLKIIHNATFERSVFQRLGIGIENVFDTLAVSRRLRGRGIDGGHGLRAVCARELELALDKGAQTSDWTRRPLSERQLAYAALDVEVLLPLHRRFAREMLL
jgi:ATP-dependent Lhr-like helicase